MTYCLSPRERARAELSQITLRPRFQDSAQRSHDRQLLLSSFGYLYPESNLAIEEVSNHGGACGCAGAFPLTRAARDTRSSSHPSPRSALLSEMEKLLKPYIDYSSLWKQWEGEDPAGVSSGVPRAASCRCQPVQLSRARRHLHPVLPLVAASAISPLTRGFPCRAMTTPTILAFTMVFCAAILRCTRKRLSRKGNTPSSMRI